MDGHTFDALARRLTVSPSRRGAIAVLGGALITAVLGPARFAEAGCKKIGKSCDKSRDCCEGARCKKGKCKCQNGFSVCDKICYDLANDPRHCGACGNACAAGDLCREGSCLPSDGDGDDGGGDTDECSPACPAGRTCCNGSCLDTSLDPISCGACGVVCGAGVSCCDGVCIDTRIHLEHCGACGKACHRRDNCVDGVCTTPDGCPVGADTCTGELVSCPGGDNCICSRSTEGKTICGNGATFGAACGQCDTSADCASFGAGAFCVDTGSTFCCGPTAQNVCRLRCPE